MISPVAALTALNDSTIARWLVARARTGRNATFARGDCGTRFSRELVIHRGVFALTEQKFWIQDAELWQGAEQARVVDLTG